MEELKRLKKELKEKEAKEKEERELKEVKKKLFDKSFKGKLLKKIEKGIKKVI